MCPHCGHDRAWRNGHRNGRQRWLCKNCVREYVEPVLNEALSRPVPNLLLAEADEKYAEQHIGVQGGTARGGKVEKCEQIQNSDLLKDFPEGTRAKILQFSVKRENQGYKDTKFTVRILALLQRKGADLLDLESVKASIAKMNISESSKKNYCERYQAFLSFLGGSWEKPRYIAQQKIPFIPAETEIDQLIASLSRMIATFCQILKETAAREGEAARLKWTDIDFERHLIMINAPEKNSNTGVYKVSEKCMEMIKQLPRKSERIFSNKRILENQFYKQRKRTALKLSNPRLNKITLHTFRHWKATMEYHKTKDPFYVKDFLRHKNIQNTQIYITIERTIFESSSTDEFTVRVAKSIDEACQLLEVGFEYVGIIHGLEVFRKRR